MLEVYLLYTQDTYEPCMYEQWLIHLYNIQTTCQGNQWVWML